MKYFLISIVIIILVIALVKIIKFLRSDKRKIYKTTDGYFKSNPKYKKKRNVAVIHQRKDKAVAVVSLYKKRGKNPKQKVYVQNVVLTPDKHPALSEDTLVGSRISYAKTKEDKSKQSIFTEDFSPTQDKLTIPEYYKIKQGIKGENATYKKNNKKKYKRWQKRARKKPR